MSILYTYTSENYKEWNDNEIFYILLLLLYYYYFIFAMIQEH